MTKKHEELLRRVYSCDTAAGHKLRYHIMRALACEGYKQLLGFSLDGTINLTTLFIWGKSQEGGFYWANIAAMIGE